jgi:plastocyanin
MRYLCAIAFSIVALNCAGKHEDQPTADLKAGATTQSATTPTAGVEVSGKLSPAGAPPASLVTLEPQSAAPVPIKAEPAIMDQVSLEFLPAFLLVQAGQTVEFRNGEDVLHNIRVTEVAEQRPVFNIATPPFGKYEYKFERLGFYTVGCDIHQTMRADILVTATPYTTTTRQDGSFSLSGVPPGSYKLTVYGGGGAIERSVEVKNTKTDLGVIQ